MDTPDRSLPSRHNNPSSGSGTTPAGSSATPAGSGTTPAGSSATPAGSRATPAGSSATPAGSSATPAGSSATPAGSSATPAGSRATPAGSRATAVGRAATTDELLAHAGWIRALSRVLVTDSHTAEDVEQNAWLAALKRPPEHGDGLRAWWSRVVRNEASDSRRARTRREARELAAPARDDAETPLEANSALDAQRRLVAAIDALEEPLRATVIRRYVQGMTSPQIAALDGVSESTVRTRLQRAIESLRRELDEKTPGGRAAWSALLAPLAQQDVATAGALGALGTSLAVKLALGSAAAIVVLASVFALRSADVEPVSSPIAARTEVATLAPTPAVASQARTLASVLDATPPSISANESVIADPAATITARFVTAAGQPIPGAMLRSLDRAGTGECTLADAPTATSGADGRVELELRAADRSKRRGQRAGLPPETWDPVIEIGGAGWARVEVSPTATLGALTSLGDVVLSEGGDVHGRCVGEDGAPLAEIRVVLHRPDLSLAERDAARRNEYWRAGQIATAQTAGDGTYAMRGIPVGSFRMHASAEGRAPAFSDAFDLHAGDDIALPDLVSTRDEHEIRGTVLLPDGTPSTETEVEWSFGEPESWVGTRTDDDGTFMISVDPDRPVDVCAHADSTATGDALVLDVAPGTTDVVLRLPEARWMDVLVTDEAGTPIENYTLGSWLAAGRSGRSEGGAHPSGRSRAPVRARPSLVSVAAQGFVGQERGPYSTSDAPDTLTFKLSRGAVVRGVIRRDGEPADGVTVHLAPMLDVPRTRRDALAQRTGKSIGSARTRADGTFALNAERAGPHVVWASTRDGAFLESAMLSIELGHDVNDLVLDTQGTGALAGHVTTRLDARLDAAQVVLSNGLAHVCTVAVASDGSFTAPFLAPGAWRLRFAPEPRHRDEFLPEGEVLDDPTLRSFEIRVGSTTNIDVDLRDVKARGIEGSIRFGASAPARWTATLLADGVQNSRPTSAPVLADSSFRVGSEWVGWHTLSLRSSGTERRDDRIDVRVQIGASTARWELATDMGALDVTGPPNTERELRITLAGGARWVTTFRLDGEGRALLDDLAVGAATLHAPGNDAILDSTTIAAGVRAVTVP